MKIWVIAILLKLKQRKLAVNLFGTEDVERVENSPGWFG